MTKPGIIYPAARANPALLEPTRPGEHVWISIASWRMNPETLLAAYRNDRDATMMWDAENLADVSVGCYVCEVEFSERAYHRKCPGEPRA